MTSESDSGERVAVYVCYFGLCQPLVQTQVISYLRELRAAGYRLILVTFEPKDDPSREQEKTAIAARMRLDGIEWMQLPCHRQPLAKAWDIMRGFLLIRRIIRHKGARIVHARSHVADDSPDQQEPAHDVPG